MARRIDVVTIKGDSKSNRDVGKSFLITEMSATDAEAWAIQALLVLSRAGVDIPDEASGMAGLAVAGLKALGSLSFVDAKPLLDKMFTCVQYQHKPNHPPMDPEPYIEEVSTRLLLRKAIFKLHTGFSGAGDTPTTA